MRKSRQKGLHPGCSGIAILLVLAMVFTLTLAAMGNAAPTTPETTAAEEENIRQTDASPVFAPTASGNTAQVQCKASYTAAYTPEDASAVVATAGSYRLTGEQLQILYLSQVNACRTSGESSAPDFSLPLDSQECPLEAGLSWQQYFLKKALAQWQAQQALLYAAAQPQIITEEAFQPDSTDNLHEKYIAPELPVNDFLYQDHDHYSPNSMHQEYLDELDSCLDSLAQEMGYADLADAASQSAQVSAEVWTQCARDYNTAYMYFTEATYSLESADVESSGEKCVDIRHILIVPEGSQIADDGTVTATEAQWSAAEATARTLMSQWQESTKRSREAGFAQLASEISQDAGSRLNGGLYCNLRQGQLIEALDEWCFDPARSVGHATVLRSELGYHLIYLSAVHTTGEQDAQDLSLLSQQKALWQSWLEDVPLNVDYSAIALWADTTRCVPSMEDVLYPDIAHQRFPEVMVYLQQDYFSYPFGDRYIGKNGCGITTWAMLATYMTDSIQTPAMMADRFSNYFDYITHATDGNIFIYAPAEMGFYYDSSVYSVDRIIPAIQNGQIVVSLQQKGHFTSSGHFLILSDYYEEDDTFQVRDSNIFNYGNKQGHRTDSFTRGNITSGGENYYIMQPKVTAIPACSRCGGEFEDHQPEKLLNGDYVCEKCTTALSRRNHFLSLLEEF